MEVTLYLPGLICILGLVIYFLGLNPSGTNTAKVWEVGRIMFFVGLFVIVLNASHLVVK